MTTGDNDRQSERTFSVDLIHVIAMYGNATLPYRFQRLSPSRYIYFPDGLFSEEAFERYAEEMAGDIIGNPPKLIIAHDEIYSGVFIELLTDSRKEEFERFLENEYELQPEGYGFLVYRRMEY